MMDFLYYNLRVAVLIAVFYMFYRLLLSRDSFHQLNRLVLLGTALASFVLPLCVITIHHTEVLSSLPTVETAVVGGGGASVVPSTPWWHITLPIVYWSGVFFTLLIYNSLDIEGMHTYWPMREAPAGRRLCHCRGRWGSVPILLDALYRGAA